MTANIQFCGGCNPRYDRGALARRIREEFPELEFFCNAKADTDIVLILCGCDTACAKVPEEYGAMGRLIVHSGDSWDKVDEFLRCVLKRTASGLPKKMVSADL